MKTTGACISTIQFACLPPRSGDSDRDYEDEDRDGDTWLGPFELFAQGLWAIEKRLTPTKHLGPAQIHPSPTRMYTKTELLDVLKTQSGLYPYVCSKTHCVDDET